MSVETVEDISTQESVLLWNGHDFEITESGTSYFQGDQIDVYDSLYTIVALRQNGAGGQEAKLINKVSGNARDVSRRVQLSSQRSAQSGADGTRDKGIYK